MSEVDWGPDGSKEAFLTRIRKRNLEFLQESIKKGWWKSVDARGDPVPNDLVVFLSKLNPDDRNMPSIMFAAKLFASKGEAKRNGWKGDPVLGEHKVGRQIVKIVP